MEPSSCVLNITALVGVFKTSILNKNNSNREMSSSDMAFGLHTTLHITMSDLLIG